MQEKVQTLPQIKNAVVLQKQLSQIMLTSALKQLYLTDICLEMLPFFVALENSETDDSSSYYYNLYHYAGNNPVKYTDPDGRSLLGTITAGALFAGAAAVLAAGTALVATTAGTTAIIVAPAAVKLAGELTAAGVAAIAVDKAAENAGQTLKENAKTPANSVSPDFETKEKQLGDMKKNPPDNPAYKPPKNWNGKKVKNPNGPGSGWPASNGDVWIPDDHAGTHSPHWDVEHPKDGTHTPVYPKQEGE